MALKTYRPTTPPQRFRQSLVFDEITGSKPEKSLLGKKMEKAGRGAGGRVSVRRRGGGHKARYRKVDFKRDNEGVSGKVVRVEYDPNRSANIALISYVNGEKRYIIAPKGLTSGMVISSGPHATIALGNALPLEQIPLGRVVHNVELQRGKGGQIVRSAGGRAFVAAKEGDYITLKLPSGEVRMVHKRCYATLGEIGNGDHMNVKLGKAGRARWQGHRPKVRGVAMNPVDHPHGGGEGKTSGGRHPVSPWGQPTKGYRTRKKRKPSSKFILQRRK